MTGDYINHSAKDLAQQQGCCIWLLSLHFSPFTLRVTPAFQKLYISMHFEWAPIQILTPLKKLRGEKIQKSRPGLKLDPDLLCAILLLGNIHLQGQTAKNYISHFKVKLLSGCNWDVIETILADYNWSAFKVDLLWLSCVTGDHY